MSRPLIPVLVFAMFAVACTATGEVEVTSNEVATTSHLASTTATGVNTNTGTLILSNSGCMLEFASDPIDPGPMEITVVNRTDEPARFHAWRVSHEATFEQFETHIDEERQRSVAGEDPIGARFVDLDSLIELDLQAGESGTMAGVLSSGTHAILCFGGAANGGWSLVGPIAVE